VEYAPIQPTARRPLLLACAATRTARSRCPSSCAGTPTKRTPRCGAHPSLFSEGGHLTLSLPNFLLTGQPITCVMRRSRLTFRSSRHVYAQLFPVFPRRVAMRLNSNVRPLRKRSQVTTVSCPLHSDAIRTRPFPSLRAEPITHFRDRAPLLRNTRPLHQLRADSVSPACAATRTPDLLHPSSCAATPPSARRVPARNLLG